MQCTVFSVKAFDLLIALVDFAFCLFMRKIRYMNEFEGGLTGAARIPNYEKSATLLASLYSKNVSSFQGLMKKWNCWRKIFVDNRGPRRLAPIVCSNVRATSQQIVA